jgi:hypothetical protein
MKGLSKSVAKRSVRSTLSDLLHGRFNRVDMLDAHDRLE